MNKTIPISNLQRTCGTCTACCEGWLEGQVFNRHFYAGRPCHFKGVQSCTIYQDRPQDPCRVYKCVWLVDTNLPEWLRPDLSKVIFTQRELHGHIYWDIIETGVKIDSVILNWLFMHYATGQVKNIVYRVNGGTNYLGTEEFGKAYNGNSLK